MKRHAYAGFLFLILVAVQLPKANDILLNGYYLGKGALPFWLLPKALDDGDDVLKVNLGLFAVLTVPASGVLVNEWMGNPKQVTLWRKINFGTDLALAGGGAAYSLWLMVAPDQGDYSGLAGLMGVVFSGLYGITCLIDRVPFASEAAGSSHWSVYPVIRPRQNAIGMGMHHSF